MNNLHEIPSVKSNIADGLEWLAKQVRAGNLGARQCVVVLEELNSDTVTVGFSYFGNQSTTTQIVGMLEMAKFNAMLESP